MALGLATLSGCSDFLDQNNKSNVPSAEFYQTSAGFASLTNSAYSTLRELYNAQPQLFVAGTDLYADGKSQGVVMSQYTFTADEGIIKNFYVSCFKGIQLANSVISYGDITEDSSVRLQDWHVHDSFRHGQTFVCSKLQARTVALVGNNTMHG